MDRGKEQVTWDEVHFDYQRVSLRNVRLRAVGRWNKPEVHELVMVDGGFLTRCNVRAPMASVRSTDDPLSCHLCIGVKAWLVMG